MTSSRGSRIKEAREAAGFVSREKFARELGASLASVTRWERDRNDPSAKWLFRIAAATGQPVEFFNVTDEVAA